MLESCVRLRPQCKGITWRKQQIHPWRCSVPAFPSYAGAASPSALGKVTSRESCNVESAQSGHLCRHVGFSPKMGLGVSASHETALARSKGRRAAVPLRVTVGPGELLCVILPKFLWADKGKTLSRFKIYLCPKHAPGGRLSAGSSLLVMVNLSLLRRRDGQSNCC